MIEDYSLARLFTLQDKTVLITGGSSGLGLIMAKGMLQNGAKVYISSRNKEKCDQAIAELSDYGECVAICADVTSAEDRQNLVSRLADLEAERGLCVLINNAGTNWGAKLEEYPDKGFAKVMDTNLNAVFSLTRDLIPLLEKAASPEDPARIINIGSMDGIHVPVVQRIPTFAYSASKAALHHLTRALAVDLGPRNITVNAVAPGFFESRMTDHVFGLYKQDIEADAPSGRVGQAEEMAGIAIYLASRAGAYTNGAVIPIDGGTSISKGSKPWSVD